MTNAPNRPGLLNTRVAPGYKWKVLSTVIFGIFMVIQDTTIVYVAFQTINKGFGGNLNNTQWVISIYVLAPGITYDPGGSLISAFPIFNVVKQLLINS